MKAQLPGISEKCSNERPDSLMPSMVELPKIVEALEIISGWAGYTATKPKSLLAAVMFSDVIQII